MCGICGIVDFTGLERPLHQRLQAVADTMFSPSTFLEEKLLGQSFRFLTCA